MQMLYNFAADGDYEVPVPITWDDTDTWDDTATWEEYE